MAGITFTEGSGVNNSIFGKSQEPIKFFLEQRAEEFEANSMIKALFSMQSSTHWAEKLTGMTAMNGFQAVGENGAYPVDAFQEGYSKLLENVTWKDSFSLSREIIDDSAVINLKQRPASFITSYYRTRERFGAALLGKAITLGTSLTFEGGTFDATANDAGALFSTAHAPKVAGGNQSNLFADAFSSDALAAAECAMQGFKGENGEILNLAPDTILIPNNYALKKLVFAVIGSDKDPTTANNAFNFNFGRWNVIVWPYLNAYITANTSPWVLLDSKYNSEYMGAVFLDRTALSVRSTLDENTDANVWRGYSRFTAGFNDWRFASCGGVSGGTTLVA